MFCLAALEIFARWCYDECILIREKTMTLASKAGILKNVRRWKWTNVVYWALLYAFVSMVATKYYVYEDGLLGMAHGMRLLYQQIALLGSIIVGFAVLRHRRLETPKRVLCIVAGVLILFGAFFATVRVHLAYLLVLSVVLGLLSVCSLLTYIYEMNNSERLFGIVLAHLLVAAMGAYCIVYGRDTAEFWWLIFAVCTLAAVISFFEKKDTEWEIAVAETLPKKLYFPLILACIGSMVAVCSSMLVMQELSASLPTSRYAFFIGAAVGAVVYLAEYRFFPKPATSTLAAGFALAVIGILCYLAGSATWVMRLAAGFCGATFNICMMNLYYILCNIIRKYKNSNMFRLAPIVSNFMGIVIVVASTAGFFYAGRTAVRIWLALCLVGDVIVLSTSVFWDRGVSATAQQEEYIRFDTTLTRAQAYESVGLTEKESEVADLLLEGLSLKEIAAKLFISENTAKTHRSAIYRKMQVGTREELVAKLSTTVVPKD